MNDLPGAVIHPNGKDLASAGFLIKLNHLECQMITRRASTAIVIVTSASIIPASVVSTSTTGRADDASIRLKGAGWGGLCLNR